MKNELAQRARALADTIRGIKSEGYSEDATELFDVSDADVLEALASIVEGNPVTATLEQTACAWTPDDDGVYHTACGHVFFFDTGTIADNKQKFCGYCGGSLVEVRGAESQDMTPVVNELLQKMQAGHGIEGPHDVEALITQLREESDRALLRCCCEALACPCVTTSSVLRNSAAALESFDRKAKGDPLPEGGK